MDIHAEGYVPVGFHPTSTRSQWRGKVQCDYCAHQGWPWREHVIGGMLHRWAEKHGLNCVRCPNRNPYVVIESILDDALVDDYDGVHLEYNTTERIVQALREYGHLS